MEIWATNKCLYTYKATSNINVWRAFGYGCSIPPCLVRFINLHPAVAAGGDVVLLRVCSVCVATDTRCGSSAPAVPLKPVGTERASAAWLLLRSAPVSTLLTRSDRHICHESSQLCRIVSSWNFIFWGRKGGTPPAGVKLWYLKRLWYPKIFGIAVYKCLSCFWPN